MEKFSFLLGSAPEDFLQKKISLFHEKLISDGWSEREIVEFPNGISELLLEVALNNAISQKSAKILLYVCKSNLSNQNEIRNSVIEKYAQIADSAGIDFEMILDSDSEFVREEELGWERIG